MCWLCFNSHRFHPHTFSLLFFCLQPKSKLYHAKFAGTNHQVSTMESSHVRDARYVIVNSNSSVLDISLCFKDTGKSEFMISVEMQTGFLQTESAEQRSLLLPPPEELPHWQDKPQPMPTLPPAEMSRSRNVQRWWGLLYVTIFWSIPRNDHHWLAVSYLWCLSVYTNSYWSYLHTSAYRGAHMHCHGW